MKPLTVYVVVDEIDKIEEGLANDAFTGFGKFQAEEKIKELTLTLQRSKKTK